ERAAKLEPDGPSAFHSCTLHGGAGDPGALCGRNKMSLESLKLRSFEEAPYGEMDHWHAAFRGSDSYLGPDKKIRPQASICRSNHDQFSESKSISWLVYRKT